MPTNREFLNALASEDPSKLAEWMNAERVDGFASHESRESYEERMYEVPVSDCPYCGCDRVVIHEYNDAYERPHSYRVEHLDEKEAFNAGCFESYFAFDSVEEAVKHADMRAGKAQADEQFSVSLEPDAIRNELMDEGLLEADVDGQDTREKLEADTTETWKTLVRLCRAGGVPKERWTNDEFYKLLDRQAAITERECGISREAWQEVIDERRDALQKFDQLDNENAELRAQLDEMLENDTVASALNATLAAEVEALKAELAKRDKGIERLKRQRDEARDEAIMYRAKFGSACDFADEIRRMM